MILSPSKDRRTLPKLIIPAFVIIIIVMICYGYNEPEPVLTFYDISMYILVKRVSFYNIAYTNTVPITLLVFILDLASWNV